MSIATLLPQDEAAGLGLLLDGQAVADVHDLLAPCVGRTAGEICTYTAVNPLWPVEGVGVVVTVDWFVDPLGASAARPQRRRCGRGVGGGVRARRGGGGRPGPDRTVLLSIYRRISVDAEVANAVGGGRGRGVLADVVRRVLAGSWTRDQRPDAGATVGRRACGPFLGRKPLPVVPAASETRNQGSRSR